MAKKNKLSTPEWILQGYNSEEEYNKKKGIISKKKPCSGSPKALNSRHKTFAIKVCPKCGSDDVGIVLKEQGKTDEWECHKCGWRGKDIQEKELSEEEFIKYIESKK